MKHQDRAGGTLRRHEAPFFNQACNGVFAESPERIGRGCQIVPRLQYTTLVAFRDQHQGSIKFRDFIHKDRDVHGTRFGH